MLYAIISDIHGNLAAFTAVLKDISNRGKVERIWCLGDVVGYGPDPHECVELLRQTEHICVAGNHDWAATGKVDTTDFNPDALIAAQWTKKQLTAEDVKYLNDLPMVVTEGNFTLVHGSPRDPIWEYIFSTSIAQVNFEFFRTQYCLVGHSHVPMVFNINEQGNCTVSRFLANIGLALGKNRLIINPGGVGQPRDSEPQASYAIYDSETKLIKLYRVTYDIRKTQDKMVEVGLPIRLVARLSYGV